MELFVIIFDSFHSLTIVIKSSIVVAAGALGSFSFYEMEVFR